MIRSIIHCVEAGGGNEAVWFDGVRVLQDRTIYSCDWIDALNKYAPHGVAPKADQKTRVVESLEGDGGEGSWCLLPPPDTEIGTTKGDAHAS